jgi:hypothetical protein
MTTVMIFTHQPHTESVFSQVNVFLCGTLVNDTTTGGEV